MAVASDTLYNSRMASYVSSSAYYGYVPLCTRENMFDRVDECNSDDSVPSTASNHYVYGSAMETDVDDGYDYSAASCRLNNHYVIPEASLRDRYEIDNRHQQNCLSLTEQQQAAQGAETTCHRNRKRSNNDSGPARELKKLREAGKWYVVEKMDAKFFHSLVKLLICLVFFYCGFRFRGGGNGRVYYGTGSEKDYGLASVHYESTSLRLNSIDDKTSKLTSVLTESCCGAVGNHSLIYNPDYRHLSTTNASKSSESSVELGELLFETHGCSIYQHYRQELAKHDIETEF